MRTWRITHLKGVCVWFILCLLFTGNQAFTQEPSPLKLKVEKQKLVYTLEKAIPQLMTEANVPGLAIAVIRNGKIIWHKGFGIKSTVTGELVTDNTIFEAASLTKPFFAYLVLKMVETGELNLDVPLIKYAPGDYIEKKYIGHSMDLEGFRKDWFGKITARMVLSHSSGLPHGGPRKPLPILFEPGKKYRYSADGYMYLQRILEHLKGEPLHEIMKKHVITPLKMNDSSMVWQERYETQAAVGHDVLGETTGKFRKRTRAHAAASLYTTAKDYAKFVAAVMNNVGLKKETVNTMLTSQVDVDKDVFWSLGFGLERTDNGYAFWQWGDYGIFRSYITAFKEHKIAVVYLTNSYNGLSIGHEIVKLAIGGGKNLGLSYLNYSRYNSPVMTFTRTILKEGIDKAVASYYKLKETHPDDFKEGQMNRLGYSLLGARKFKEAIEIFKLNVKAFPKSANTYDSLAEAYMRTGNNELAVRYYQKALEMIPGDPRPDKEFLQRLKTGAREQLKKLQKKK